MYYNGPAHQRTFPVSFGSPLVNICCGTSALLEVYIMFPSEAHQEEQAAHHHNNNNTLDPGVLQIGVL